MMLGGHTRLQVKENTPSQIYVSCDDLKQYQRWDQDRSPADLYCYGLLSESYGFVNTQRSQFLLSTSEKEKNAAESWSPTIDAKSDGAYVVFLSFRSFKFLRCCFTWTSTESPYVSSADLAINRPRRKPGKALQHFKAGNSRGWVFVEGFTALQTRSIGQRKGNRWNLSLMYYKHWHRSGFWMSGRVLPNLRDHRRLRNCSLYHVLQRMLYPEHCRVERFVRPWGRATELWGGVLCQ